MASNTEIRFSDLGIHSPSTTQNTILGKARSFNSLRKLEKLFIIVSLLCILVVIGITIERLVAVDKKSADFTFAVVLLINACFCVYYTIGGVFLERLYDLGILVLATSIIWLYLVLNYAIGTKNTFKMVRLIIASVLSPFVIGLGVVILKSYNESNNLIFRTVGANPGLQSICRTLHLFFGLLKADMQISLSLAVLILTSGRDLDLEDKIVLPLSLVFAVTSAVVGYLSVRLENKPLVIVYAAIWITMPAYAVYMIVKSVKDLSVTHDNTPVSNSIVAVTFVAAGISLIVRVLILYFGFKTYLGFGKGLRERVYGAATTTGDKASVQTE